MKERLRMRGFILPESEPSSLEAEAEAETTDVPLEDEDA
jgi:hypothetical protein